MAKILVADDNSNIQKMVGLALKDQGIDVVAVGNGEAAVRKISDIRPDLVLADVFMPVRNGYEVCRYVKDDSALSHIPVILLVGAFDPLDEQEAQRVGADGVLKKPFVPPDPLISMVKSALSRAGVSLGNEPAEKGPAPVVPMAKETLAPKAAVPPPVPEAEVEPVLEDFPAPAPPPSVKIASGSEPVAFGSLLDTPEAEEDLGYVSKPTEALEAARKWSSAETEEEEEDEQKGGWRPGGMEGDREEEESPAAGGQKDWRDEAFHGSSPVGASKSHRWTPAENTQLAHADDAPSVAVSTIDGKPAPAAAPFAGDSWAAAMASNVEDTVIGAQKQPSMQDAAPTAPAAEESRPAVEEQPSTPATANLAASTETPWEVEAKKASMFASTWDAPVPEPPAAAPPAVAEAEKFFAEEPAASLPEPVNETVNAYAADLSSQTTQEFVAEAQETDSLVTSSAYSSSELLTGDETQEIPAYTENASSYATPQVTEEVAAPQAGEPAHTFETAEDLLPSDPATAAAEPATAPQANMDELVARVVAKMNPDILRKVTQEILRPVIEALIKDELNAKK